MNMRTARRLGSMVRGRALLLAFAVTLRSEAAEKSSVLSYHGDPAGTGANLQEVTLTHRNVNSNSFGKIFSYPVDGHLYAQPLVLPEVSIPGAGVRDVVFVATQHNSVYAFDADPHPTNSTAPLWQVSFIDPSAGITTVPDEDVSGLGSIVPEIGITSTPVIDPGSGTLYVLAKTKEVRSGVVSYAQRLHALNVATGAEKFGGPVLIEASVPGNGDGSDGTGRVRFDSHRQLNRPGLLFLNGVVYICWASHGDTCPYHGWMIGYDARTLKQVSAINTTPNGGMGGIWQGAAAPRVDSLGNIYVITGNGTFDADQNGRNYGNTFLKLSPSLAVLDYFTPYNQAELEARDDDLGSSGALVLPDEVGKRRLLVGAGKEGTIYLLDRESMGGFNAKDDSRIVQVLTNVIGPALGTPAYFDRKIYYAGVNDRLKAFALVGGKLEATPVGQTGLVYPYPGATPAISANGKEDPIVWIIERRNPAVLRAYDANDLSRELYNSRQVEERDGCGPGVKFTVPVIANGKVYVGTQNRLEIFGTGRWVATPEIAAKSGMYTNTVFIEISSRMAGAEIRYTLDDSEPRASSRLYTEPFTLTNSATLRARAFAEGMQPSVEATAKYTIYRTDLPPGEAMLTGIDLRTKGAWRGRYGLDGYLLATGARALPRYAEVTMVGESEFVFDAPSASDAALETPDGAGRSAGTWYAESEFTIDLALRDGGKHVVVLYAFDPSGSRTQRMEICDARSGAVLGSHDLVDFTQGKYVRWEISGHVKIKVTRTGGANAVVSGIFFGAAPFLEPPSFSPGGRCVRWADHPCAECGIRGGRCTLYSRRE